MDRKSVAQRETTSELDRFDFGRAQIEHVQAISLAGPHEPECRVVECSVCMIDQNLLPGGSQSTNHDCAGLEVNQKLV